MKHKKTRKREFKPVAAVMRAVDMPEETDDGIVKLTMLGFRRALIENHRGIFRYSDENILLSVPDGYLNVEGRNLKIREFNRECALVEGNISGIYHED